MGEPRQWLYGLTADEWLHIAAIGQDSEVAPCCSKISAIRETINWLATSQSKGESRLAGKTLLDEVECDGEGHNLHDRALFPLLHRVMDGARAELAEWEAKAAADRARMKARTTP